MDTHDDRRPGLDDIVFKPILARVRGEFREMPGLTLTLPQAARLFGVPESGCQRVLEQLVTDGLLRRRPDGRYTRNAA
jgi:DNA-binding IclR family transcriptional regulator